jgi:hypothetical protein
MIFKSFIISVISILVFFLSIAAFYYFILNEKAVWQEFAMLLFYGGSALLVLVFPILCLLNLVVKKEIQRLKKMKPGYVYFLYGVIFTVLPIWCFVLFDYSDRGRFFEEKTFFSISAEYAVYLILAGFVILLNRKIVWDNFKNYESKSR